MKIKRSAVFIIGLMLSMFLINVVSAQEIGKSVSGVIDTIVEGIEPVARYILGTSVGEVVPGFSPGELLFAKVLFFVILLSIIWVSLNKVPFFNDTEWVLWLVSIGVAILSTRFIGNALVPTILLPYTTLGIAISAALPLVVYFLIIDVGLSEKKYKAVRKVAWIFFAIIFIVLWISRADSLKSIEGTGVWIYPITALVAFLMLLFDGTINSFFKRIEIDRVGAEGAETAITEIKKKIHELQGLFSEGIITESEMKQREKKYKKRLKLLYK